MDVEAQDPLSMDDDDPTSPNAVLDGVADDRAGRLLLSSTYDRRPRSLLAPSYDRTRPAAVLVWVLTRAIGGARVRDGCVLAGRRVPGRALLLAGTGAAARSGTQHRLSSRIVVVLVLIGMGGKKMRDVRPRFSSGTHRVGDAGSINDHVSSSPSRSRPRAPR
jgi:hypothetical protein